MMKIRNLLILAVILVAWMVSCKHKPDPAPQDEDPKVEDTTMIDSSCLEIPVLTIEKVKNLECGDSLGYLLVSASGGSGGPYLYSYNGGGFIDVDSLDVTSVGQYKIQAMDSSGCISLADSVSIIRTSNITFTTMVTNTVCGGSVGSIEVTSFVGGTAPYMVSINGGAFGSDTVFSDLSAANYIIQVRDAEGCITSKNVIVNDGGNISVTLEITDAVCGISDGEVIVHATGGSGSYVYSSSAGGSQSDSVFVVSDGSYSFSASDSSGCTGVANGDVSLLPSDLNFTAVSTNSNCLTGTGTITVTASGGAGNYEYKLGTGSYSTSNIFSGLLTGSYSVTIRDSAGCTVNKTVAVGLTPPSYASDVAPILSSTCSSIDCHGTPTGSKPSLANWNAVNTVKNKIKTQLENGNMPQDTTISENNKNLIICWIEAGAPDN